MGRAMVRASARLLSGPARWGRPDVLARFCLYGRLTMRQRDCLWASASCAGGSSPMGPPYITKASQVRQAQCITRKRRPAQRIHQIAGGGVGHGARHGGQAGEQGKLGGGVRRVGAAGDKGNKRRRAQPTPSASKANRQRHSAQIRAPPGPAAQSPESTRIAPRQTPTARG